MNTVIGFFVGLAIGAGAIFVMMMEIRRFEKENEVDDDTDKE